MVGPEGYLVGYPILAKTLGFLIYFCFTGGLGVLANRAVRNFFDEGAYVEGAARLGLVVEALAVNRGEITVAIVAGLAVLPVIARLLRWIWTRRLARA
jgi:hypothetical protein